MIYSLTVIRITECVLLIPIFLILHFYSLLTLRKPRCPLVFIGERGFLRVNRLDEMNSLLPDRLRLEDYWRRAKLMVTKDASEDLSERG